MISASHIQQIETSLRQARIGEARAALEKIPNYEIPRDLLAKIAELHRRAGLTNDALRLLNKTVLTEVKGINPASAKEQAEYAMALVKAGALHEARSLLHRIDARKEPLALLYTALSYFPEWDYEKSLELLESFLKIKEIDEYHRLIGEVNLTAAYVSLEKWSRAKELLAVSLEHAEKVSHHLLRANLLELSAQVFLADREFVNAEKSLKESAEILKNAGLFDELYVKKWMALLACYRDPSKKNLNNLQEVRTLALEQQHWESVRDIDFHRAFLTQDKELYHYLFHGTPHEAYRQRLKKKFKGFGAVQKTFERVLGEGSAAVVLNLRETSINKEVRVPQIGNLQLRLLQALASDFYRPQRISSLAGLLFAEEHYNPHTMPNRIHQVVKRLREWIETHNLDLEVEVSDAGFGLKSSKGIILKTGVEGSEETVSPQVLYQIQQLRAAGLIGEFSSKEAANALGCSLSTATRVLNNATKAGIISRVNASAHIKYRFSSEEI
jgi:tetratricopeptide (TPR) repeat protein